VPNGTLCALNGGYSMYRMNKSSMFVLNGTILFIMVDISCLYHIIFSRES